jgi:hypothetical protein
VTTTGYRPYQPCCCGPSDRLLSVGISAAGSLLTGKVASAAFQNVRAYELMLLQREALLQRTRLLGPAFVAAVAYVDPGNVATNTQAGAAFGYLLLWVLVGATFMAGLVQYLSAKVGWLTGETLPELVARRSSRLPRICYWLQAELVAMATDLPLSRPACCSCKTVAANAPLSV